MIVDACPIEDQVGDLDAQGMKMGAFDRFAARVARLTAEESASLAAAHRPPSDTEATRRWYGDQRIILELGLSGFEALDRAYSLAEPFRNMALYRPVLDVGLVLVDAPRDRSITETILAGWRSVFPDEPLDVA